MSATLTRPPVDDLRTLYATAPERSVEQRMVALARANQVRSGRARLKVDIKAGRERVPDLLADPPECIATMKVFDLLLAAPHYGRVKAAKALRVVGVSPSKNVAGLSGRQREELLRLLRATGARRVAR